MRTVAVVATGSELLYGRVQDSNSAFLSDRLFAGGFKAVLHMAVGDVVDDLSYAFGEAVRRADIVMITGGLGPTEDDRTLEVLTAGLGLSREVNRAARERMEGYFRAIGRNVLETDLKMATVPRGAHVFENEVGLAVGYACDVGEKLIIAMPGVPRELEIMFERRVLPFLKERYHREPIQALEFRILLDREAEVDRRVGALEIPFDRVEWGITSRTGMNVVRFVGKDGTEFPAGQIKEKMNERFRESLLSPGVESCEEEVLRLLAGKGLTLAVAESCTGGLVSKRITDVPGSSKSFLGAVVAYADEAKKNLLDVPPGILHTYGAVSEETARAMALGALRRFGADCALSVTGIAGPGGGTPEKPAGTVCFGTACGGRVETFTRNIIGDRERVRAMASQYAMDSLRRRLK